MSTEMITGNDLKAILNEVLPPTPSEYKKLLWQNPNPTAAFAAQTVALNLSDYDEVEIVAKRLNTDTSIMQTRATSDYIASIASVYGASTVFRSATITTTGVSFGGGNLDGSVNNNYAIPLKIYGIKYERVAPPLADMEWKEAGRTTSTSDWIDLPATAKEVNLIAVVGGTIYSGYRSLAEPIISVTTWMFGGYYAGTSDYGYANVNMRNSGRSFQKRHCYYAGTNYDSAATLIVYYR